MSILIKGLDMPTVGSIEIQVFSEGRAIKSGYTFRVNGTDYYQPTIGETSAVDAIQLPAEHGRLIDADALIARIRKAKELQPELSDLYENEALEMLLWVGTETTIIEAEEGET